MERNRDIGSRSYWDWWAARYPDPFTSVQRSSDPEELAIIAKDLREKLALSPEDVLLDLGCGSGKLGEALRPWAQRIEGVDWSPEMLQVARQHSPGITYHLGTCANIPFSDQTFDKVLCYGVLQCCRAEDVPALFKEVRRVLKPGGRALLGDIPSRKHKPLFFYELIKSGLALLLRPRLLATRLRVAFDMRGELIWHDLDTLVVSATQLGWRAQIVRQPVNRQFGRKTYTHQFDILLSKDKVGLAVSGA